MTKRYAIFDETIVEIFFVADTDAQVDESVHQMFGNYHLRFDPPHTSPGKKHVHVALRKGNKELFAINQDGTAHDQSHGIRVPRDLRDYLRGIRPGWTVPKVLESITIGQLIAESMAD